MTTWYQKLEDYWSVRLSSEKANRWMRILSEELESDVTDAELCKTLEFVKKSNEYNPKDRPNLGMLEGWIKWHRKTMARNRNAYLCGEKNKAEYLEWIKKEIRKASSDAIKWDILCKPSSIYPGVRDTTREECDMLYDWLQKEFKNFKIPEFKFTMDLFCQNIINNMEKGIPGKDEVPF